MEIEQFLKWNSYIYYREIAGWDSSSDILKQKI